MRAEREKLAVGRATGLMVAQAQRDLVASQIDEVEATANYLKGMVELFRQDGSLLVRRGLEVPGLD